MRVLVVAGEAPTRRRLVSMLRTWGIQVVGETVEPRKVLEIARRSRPNAILIDAALLARAGEDTTLLLEAELPGTKVVVADLCGDGAAGLGSTRGGAGLAWLDR